MGGDNQIIIRKIRRQLRIPKLPLSVDPDVLHDHKHRSGSDETASQNGAERKLFMYKLTLLIWSMPCWELVNPRHPHR